MATVQIEMNQYKQITNNYDQLHPLTDADITSLTPETQAKFPSGILNTDAALAYLAESSVGNAKNVTATYPVAAGMAVTQGDVVDIVNGEVINGLQKIDPTHKSIVPNAADWTKIIKYNNDYSLCFFSSSTYSSVNAGWCAVQDNNLALTKTPYQIPGAANVKPTYIDAVMINDNQFVMVYNINNIPRAGIGTVNTGLAVTFGNTPNIDTQSTYNNIIVLTPTRFLVVYIKNSTLVAQVLQKQENNSIALGTPIALSNFTTIAHVNAQLFSNNKVLVSFNSNLNPGTSKHDGYVVMIDVADSGTNLVWGTPVSYTSFETPADHYYPTLYVDGNDVIVVDDAYTSAVAKAEARIINVNGDTITVIENSLIELGTWVGGNSITITKVNNQYVVTYSSGSGRAVLLSKNNNTLTIEDSYIFVNFPTGNMNYNSATFINNNQMLVFIPRPTSLYPTIYKLEVKSNQIAGGFKDSRSMAISLSNATAGQPCDVIYSGIIAAPWITENQIITSDGQGVYGLGVLDGFLQVYAKNRPGKIVTGTYVGNGTYGLGNPNTITFAPGVKAVFIGDIGQGGGTNCIVGLWTPFMYRGSINVNQSTDLIWTATSLKWYSLTNAHNQMNSKDITYHYVLFY